MNKRMLGELYKQAHVPHTAIDPSNNMPYETTCFSANKFAELIVKECIEAIQNESMNSYDDWERGLRIAEGAIEKHFGVEE